MWKSKSTEILGKCEQCKQRKSIKRHRYQPNPSKSLFISVTLSKKTQKRYIRELSKKLILTKLLTQQHSLIY